jgi:hypothetical protein
MYDDGEGRESRVWGKAVEACIAYEALLALFSLFADADKWRGQGGST